MNKPSKLLISCILLISFFELKAVPAYPYPIKIQQSDGSYLTILLKGDEFFHYQTTEDGYPIVKNENGIYNYAKFETNGELTSTNIKATDKKYRTLDETAFIESLSTDVHSQSSNFRKKVKQMVSSQIMKPSKFPVSGTPSSLVILVNFSDRSFVVNDPKTAFTNLLNQEGYSTNGGTGSARDYFKDNSMQTFIPQFDIVGPYTLSSAYSTYGKNDSYGNDQNPVQMVIDACELAAKNGVDLSKYDTDKDNYIDNVFIYYAGYNEAEGAPSNTIWPHRWGVYPTITYGTDGNYSGSLESITFSGKRLMDYACTSELKGTSGSNMCGIGTFCHEFGHVLGLVDFYATNNGKHQTLSDWDIMDGGPYLNGGKTPPAYSGHERFYLGWLKPTELKSPRNVVLSSITSSNKAYLITQNGNSNLNGANPSPTEYFILENRQKTGWDTYLPGHGLLITRVNYNATDWKNNESNNDPTAMGVDIIEADGIANDQTLAGDPFPGTSNITNYNPLLRNGIDIQKPITSIQEDNGVISFKFMGGSDDITPPDVFEATDITDRSFVIKWESTTQYANEFYVTVVDYNGNTIVNKQATTQLSDTIYNLVSDRDYKFYVQAGESGSDELSDPSETKTVHTLPYSSNKTLRVINDNNGNLLVFLPEKEKNISVYNVIGQRIMNIVADNEIVNLNMLPKNQIYIIQSEKLRAKVRW
ncbi:MAG: M6 family metalloprotease domain-containing protein [Paludibacteraceae bacterium]